MPMPASSSGAVPIGAKTLCGIVMPSAWTSAGLSFQVSVDGGTTWLELQSTSAAVSYTAAASQYIQFDPAPWRGINMIKVRSGTLGAPVAQTGGAVGGLVIRSEMS